MSAAVLLLALLVLPMTAEAKTRIDFYFYNDVLRKDPLKHALVIFNHKDLQGNTRFRTDAHGKVSKVFKELYRAFQITIVLSDPHFELTQGVFSATERKCTGGVWTLLTVREVQRSSKTPTVEVTHLNVPPIWNALQDAYAAVPWAHINAKPQTVTACESRQKTGGPGGNGFLQGSRQLFVNTRSPNYSPQVVYHEYGHALMYFANGKYSVDGCYSHRVREVVPATCAWSEGWADFFAMVVTKKPTFQGDDLEHYRSDIMGTQGYNDEGRAAAGLWDLYDSANDCNEMHKPEYGQLDGCDVNAHNTVSFATMMNVMSRNPADKANVRSFYRNLAKQLDSTSKAMADQIMYYNYLSKPPSR